MRARLYIIIAFLGVVLVIIGQHVVPIFSDKYSHLTFWAGILLISGVLIFTGKRKSKDETID